MALLFCVKSDCVLIFRSALDDLSGRVQESMATPRGHRRDPRDRLDRDQVAEGDLGPRRGTLDLRRRGRRDRVHRLRRQGQALPGHRPVTGAARQAPERSRRPAGSGRVVDRLAVPRGVRRLAVAAGRRINGCPVARWFG